MYFLRTRIFSDKIFSTVIKLKKFKLIQYCIIHIPILSIVSIMNFFSPFNQGLCIAFSCHVCLVSFNLEQFFSPSLSFMTLTFFYEYRPVFSFFWRMFLILGLSDVFSWLDSGYVCLAWIYMPQLIIVLLGMSYMKVPLISDINFGHLVKVLLYFSIGWYYFPLNL